VRQIRSPDRVLITEDDENVRKYLSTILKSSGLTPVEAPDGETALDMLKQMHIDLVLLDVHLPGMDGTQVLRNVKSQTPSLPVIMITGAGSVTSAVQAVKDGADDYLEKPVAPQALLQVIRRSLLAAQDREGGNASGPKPEVLPAVELKRGLPDQVVSPCGPESVGVAPQARQHGVGQLCPICQSSSARRSRFRGIEPAFLLLLCRPFRCQCCHRRFWHSPVTNIVGGIRLFLNHILVQRPWGHRN
jgi:CheY-like chemotaxis protein